jgi:hypothetical protein
MAWEDTFTAYGPGQKVTAVSSIAAAGTGYTVNDVLTLNPSSISPVTLPQWTVSTVNGSGGVTGVILTTPGLSWSATTNPVPVTGGSGSGATFNLTWGDDTKSIVVPNALPNNGDIYPPGTYNNPVNVPYTYVGQYFQANGQAQQCVTFASFTSSQKGVATFASNWSTPITNSTVYNTFKDYARGAGSSTTTIQLSAADPDVLNTDLVNCFVKVVVGTGAGQCGVPNGEPSNPANKCTAYNGSTRTMTVSPAFTFTPDNTSGYQYSARTFWDEGVGGVGYFGDLGESTDGDNCHAGVYIEGSSKWGFVTFPYLTAGDGTTTALGTYYGSYVKTQLAKSYMFIFDPNDLIKVAKGQINSYDVIPTGMTVYTPPTDATQHEWATDYSSVGGASYDSTRKELYLMVNGWYFAGFVQNLVFVYSVNC